MKSFNVVTGLPRSGSTLLCNILNQNPEFYASSTSPIAGLLGTTANYLSLSAEFKSMLIRDQAVEDRAKAGMRSFIAEWYSDNNIVFDKSRAWAGNALAMRDVFPQSLIIVTLRDLLAVFGSIEKQHRRSAFLDEAMNLQNKAIYYRADQMFSPQGLIGGAVIGVEDVYRRNIPNILYVKYESLVEAPDKVLKSVYHRLGMKPYVHDFDNVKNVAEDVDGLYLNKFPHEGSGRVQPPSNFEEWRDYVAEDLATMITEKFTSYNKMFKYERGIRVTQ